MRFSELKRELGLSPSSLSQTLFFLLDCGILLRSLTMDVPSQTEYSLTKKGRAAAKLIDSMIKLSEVPVSNEEEPPTFI